MFFKNILDSKPKFYAKIFFISNNKGVLSKTSELDIKDAIDLLETSKTSEVVIHIYSKNFFLKFLGLNIVNSCAGKGEKAIVFLKGYL